MGFRTVVMLNNDQAHEWTNAQDLGHRILHCSNFANMRSEANRMADLGYGRVVECVHADTRTLAYLEHYENFIPLAHTNWSQGEPDAAQLAILREAAAKFGYNLVKKTSRK